MLVHSGQRPKYEFVDNDRKGFEKMHFEKYPDGSGKWWTDKMLKSGCGRRVDFTDAELIYCPHCDQTFSRKEFTDVIQDTTEA